MLSQAHTHARTLCKLPKPPTLVQSDPWDHPPVRHTRGSNALSRTPSFTHSHMCAHTHRAELATSGLRQGGVSAVVAQQRGEEARPLLEGGPCEGAGRVTARRSRRLPPLLHAAPEGSVGNTIAQQGEGAQWGPGAGTRTLANPRPAGASPAPCGVAVAVEGPEMEDWAAAAEPGTGGEGKGSY